MQWRRHVQPKSCAIPTPFRAPSGGVCNGEADTTYLGHARLGPQHPSNEICVFCAPKNRVSWPNSNPTQFFYKIRLSHTRIFSSTQVGFQIYILFGMLSSAFNSVRHLIGGKTFLVPWSVFLFFFFFFFPLFVENLLDLHLVKLSIANIIVPLLLLVLGRNLMFNIFCQLRMKLKCVLIQVVFWEAQSWCGRNRNNS